MTDAHAMATDEGPRAAVIAAGHRLAASRAGSFTIDELVREAGVALQTFYRYFGGKDALLVALIADQIDEHCGRLRQAAAADTDPAARLRQHLRTTLAPLPETELARGRFTASEHWRLHQIFPNELAAATQPFADLVASELAAGRERGVLQPRDVTLDAWLITRTVMSAVHHFVYCPADWTEVVAGDVTDFCLAAVGGDVSGGPRPASERAPSRRSTARRAPRAPARRSGAAPAT